jgi:hypothetical protein
MAKIHGTNGGGRTAFGGTNGRAMKLSPQLRADNLKNTITFGVEYELKRLFPQLKEIDLRNLTTTVREHVKNTFRNTFLLEISAFCHATELLKNANITPRQETIRKACGGGIQTRLFLEVVYKNYFKETRFEMNRSGLLSEVVKALTYRSPKVRRASVEKPSSTSTSRIKIRLPNKLKSSRIKKSIKIVEHGTTYTVG